MKKVYFVVFLAFFAVFSYADDVIEAPNNNIFVEGTACRIDHSEFFQINFYNEAKALGYTITEDKSEAGYIYRYNVIPNMVMYNDGVERQAPPDEPQYVIQMSVIRNEDDFEVLSYSFLFTELDEIYEYNQFLFFRANLPFAEGEEKVVYVSPDTSWKNKWIYLRVSFDYPITVYELNDKNLYKEKSVYNGDISNPDQVSIPLNHRVNMRPGATIGVEIQFLNFMSAEVNFQINFGDTFNNWFLNTAFGAQLKFPLKFVNSLILEPYAAYSHLVGKTSPKFKDFPRDLFGGGIQVCTKGGKNGAFFIDVNYMYSIKKQAAMINPYKTTPIEDTDGVKYLFQNPQNINFNRFVIGLSAGYKYGLFNRKK